MSKRKIVYIAHPIGGDVVRNLARVEEIFRKLTDRSEVVPFTPYIQGFKHLDDSIPEHRQLGMLNNKAFFIKKSFDELWLYGTEISKGMWEEIKWAEENGIKVVAKAIGTHDDLDTGNSKKKFELSDDDYFLIETALQYLFGKRMDYLASTRVILSESEKQSIISKANKYDDLRTKINERND